MRYAIFSALFSPHIGGVETFTANLAGTLASDGDEVCIVTCALGGEAPSTSPEELDLPPAQPYSVVRLPSHALIGGRLPLRKQDASYRSLMASLEERGFDRVIVNCRFYPHSIEGISLAHRLGAKVILIEHGSAPLTLGNAVLDSALAVWEGSFTRKVRRSGVPVFAVSRRSGLWLESIGIAPSGYINNAIDAAAFRRLASDRDFRAEMGIGPDTPLVVSVGRLAPEKGPLELVRAARSPGLEHVTFALAGDGPLMRKLGSTKTENVHLLGNLDGPDVSALLKTADIFCLPTRSEGFCTSLLEAGAWGCACVMPLVGGTDELIDRSSGVVIPDREVTTISSTLRSLADDRDHGRSLGRKLSERIETGFSWDDTAMAVRAAFDAIG